MDFAKLPLSMLDGTSHERPRFGRSFSEHEEAVLPHLPLTVAVLSQNIVKGDNVTIRNTFMSSDNQFAARISSIIKYLLTTKYTSNKYRTQRK